MSQKILQINFKFNVPRAQYEQAVAQLAEPVAAVPGVLWKVWIMNEAENEAGGITLFANEDTLQDYLDGEIVAGIVSHPALSDFSVKTFDVLHDLSMITRAPITMPEAT